MPIQGHWDHDVLGPRLSQATPKHPCYSSSAWLRQNSHQRTSYISQIHLITIRLEAVPGLLQWHIHGVCDVLNVQPSVRYDHDRQS